MRQQRTTVFVSYCGKNRRWLDRLKVHLKPYDRRGDLDLWDDSHIDAGDHWHSEISAAIERAAASVMLVSADFLASDFVAVHELPKLLHKAANEGARILPVYVEPCDLANHAALAALQAVNSPQKPLAELTRVEAERVLVRVAEAIGRILSPAAAARPKAPRPQGTPADASAEMFDELQTATITLSILWALTGSAGCYTLTELEGRLHISSRKKAYEALDRLVANDWVEKSRSAGRTKYQITKEGIRQVQRLAASTDGPVRRAAALS